MNCAGLREVIEKIGGRDRDRTGDPLLAKQIQAFIETYDFLLVLSNCYRIVCGGQLNPIENY
jgi:hypothetical protein